MKQYEEFIEYLNAQIGEPYLWGGQHTKLTPENYESVIAKKEAKTGGYDGGPTYAEAAKAYCRKQFENGKDVLYAYDCSGLGVYWLYNVKHIYKGDCTADTMMKRCEIHADDPKCGWWVFCVNDKGKATHVGYMVSDTEVIEAKGRKYGVVRGKFKRSAWKAWGIPAVFKDELAPQPVPPGPEPKPEPGGKHHVRVKGGSVNVRDGGSTDARIIHTAHRGEVYDRYGDDAPSGWYGILFHGQQGYISNKEKYTELIE